MNLQTEALVMMLLFYQEQRAKEDYTLLITWLLVNKIISIFFNKKSPIQTSLQNQARQMKQATIKAPFCTVLLDTRFFMRKVILLLHQEKTERKSTDTT